MVKTSNQLNINSSGEVKISDLIEYMESIEKMTESHRARWEGLKAGLKAHIQ